MSDSTSDPMDSGERDAAAALDRMRSGDPAGLSRLAELFGRRMSRAAYLMVGDTHAAEDLVHDALIAAWDAKRSTTIDTPVRAWLLGILLNLCRRRRRGTERRVRREQAVAWAPTAGVADETEAVARRDTLARAMDRLDEPLREVVVLRFEQQLSVAETARVLGAAEGTVKSRTHAALAKMRSVLTDRMEERR